MSEANNKLEVEREAGQHRTGQQQTQSSNVSKGQGRSRGRGKGSGVSGGAAGA